MYENQSTNIVENFNGIINKFVGGKRINFSLGSSYQYKCLGAAIHHNSKSGLTRLNERIFNKTPKLIKKIEENRYKKVLQNRKMSKTYTKNRKISYADSKDYGEMCNQPDCNLEQLNILASSLIDRLKKQKQVRESLERETVNQTLSEKWVDIHENILTA